MRFVVCALGIALMACASARRAPPTDEAVSAPALPAPHDDGSGCANAPEGTVCFAQGLGSIGRDAPEAHFEERPPRATRLHPFAMDRTEVSVQAWRVCRDAGRCAEPACPMDAPDRPVRCVGWDDAVAYCVFRHGRLPTEAEWERVAAGVLPEHRVYPWGNAPTPSEAMADVTPEGIDGMGGGVAEWVMDPGGFYPAAPSAAAMDAGAMAEVPEDDGDGGERVVSSTVTIGPAVERTAGGMVIANDPRGPVASPWRVVRGGDDATPIAARTTSLRRFRQRADRLPWVGLRCVY